MRTNGVLWVLSETVRWSFKTHVSGSAFFPVTRARGSQQSKMPGNAQAKHSHDSTIESIGSLSLKNL